MFSSYTYFVFIISKISSSLPGPLKDRVQVKFMVEYKMVLTDTNEASHLEHLCPPTISSSQTQW